MAVLEKIALRLNEATDRIRRLPVLVLLPHSRCNCRCIMCDIWRANERLEQIEAKDLEPHINSMRRLGVRRIVLSGGEALMHRNLWSLCGALAGLDAKITLLSTGLLLRRHAEAIREWVDEVIVSLDGSPAVHDRIRNLPRAFDRLADGVAAVRAAAPHVTVGARCVLQKGNFDDFAGVLDAAVSLKLDWISFLAADVSSEAFNRPGGWPAERRSRIALTLAECDSLDAAIRRSFETHRALYDTGLVAESQKRLLRIVEHFRGLHDEARLPEQHCNAPWVSAVVEPDGRVRPCYFHDAYGSIREAPLAEILNSRKAIRFRRSLDVRTNPVCKRCVCTLTLR